MLGTLGSENMVESVNYRDWDWLPKAADEAEAYFHRLLAEAAIAAHNVTARAKSIGSFEDKCSRKNYDEPQQEVTDTVAVRIITYSVTDRVRAVELIRNRFEVKDNEDRNPGEEKDEQHRGYDCHHLVVKGESPEAEGDWMTEGGKLCRYFQNFGGLEVQVRTVAAHAWAEFEHARRYKGESYEAITDQDRMTIDTLFGAAADARSALDETFVVIDRMLANPTPAQPIDERLRDSSVAEPQAVDGRDSSTSPPLVAASLREFLACRFPKDEEASKNGLLFACDLVRACGLTSIEALSAALDAIDSDQVLRLMDMTTAVTRVRRLDDALLARFGEPYIQWTGDIGSAKNRNQQLTWRFDRLRNKVRYSTYELAGADCPPGLREVRLPAARAVREVASVVADGMGLTAALQPNAVGASVEDLLPGTRPKEVITVNGQSLWVATNLNRQASEELMVRLLDGVHGIDLRVMNNESEVASSA